MRPRTAAGRTTAAAAPTARTGHRLGRWAWSGVLVGSLMALVTWAPAAWLAHAVQHFSGERVVLADARGSIWRGDAVLVLTGGAGSRDARTLPGRLNWRLSPGWRSSTLTVYQACCIPRGLDLNLTPGLNRWQLALQAREHLPTELVPAGTAAADLAGASSHWGRLPAELLSGLGTPFNTMELGGQLGLQSQNLVFEWVSGRFQMQGVAVIDLPDIRSRLTTLPTLGSYRFSLSSAPNQAGTAQVSLQTVEGALVLSADGTWGTGGLRLRGQAHAQEEQQGALSNLLNVIGRRDGNRSILTIG